MDFRLAATFTDALARLPAQEQKAVKVSVLDLQLDPSAPGLQMHRIDKSRDEHFWSARVGRDLRLILHKTEASILVAYVGHHDRRLRLGGAAADRNPPHDGGGADRRGARTRRGRRP